MLCWHNLPNGKLEIGANLIFRKYRIKIIAEWAGISYEKIFLAQVERNILEGLNTSLKIKVSLGCKFKLITNNRKAILQTMHLA